MSTPPKSSTFRKSALHFGKWLLAAMVSFAVWGSEAAQAQQTIFPVGDSITYGTDSTNPASTGGYRTELYNQLVAAGISFNFVGSAVLNPSPTLTAAGSDYTSHEGHPGYTIQQIGSNLTANGATGSNNGGFWITGGGGTGRGAINPTIVLVNIGTNNFNGSSAAQVYALLETMLNSLKAALPNAHIFVSSLTPRTDDSFTNSTEAQYNTLISQNIASFGSKFHFVDLRTGFPANGLGPDGLHPNQSGYNWMGLQWANAIKAFLGNGSVPAAPTGLSATAGNAQVTLNWSATPGATSYNIYRGMNTPSSESATPIATGITTTSYTNTSLANGTAFYYKIKAVNSVGTSAYSNEATATPVGAGGTGDINLAGYTLTFADEFNTLSATATAPKGAANWFALPPNGAPGYFSASIWDINSMSVSGGVLSNKAWKDGNNAWHSGFLASLDSTGAGFSQQYGYFSIRCRMPNSGTGTWPSFWLEQLSTVVGNPPTSEEIDVFEWYGTSHDNIPGLMSQSSHNWYANGTENTSLPFLSSPMTQMPDGSQPWAGYHIYGVKIDPVHITWYIDGVQTNQIATPTSYLNSPFYLIVDHALGGGWPLDGVVNNSSFDVDWVRVYSLPSSGDTTAPTVSVTSPTNGASVSGSTVNVAATAADNVGIAGVQFKLDGSNLGGEVTSAPYSLVWNSTTASNGSHAITAVARDAAGNTATSSTVTVTVSNSGGSGNLALNRPTSASSTSGAYTPGNAVDGSTGSRWSSNYSTNEWIYVDLGATYSINRVQLTWEAAYGKSYQIQTSNDASTWNTIYSTTTGAGGVNNLTGLSGTGRYVRMNGTVRGLPDYGYSLWEFEVYGTAGGDTTAPTVSITAPANNATVSGATVSVSANAADAVGVVGVQFKLDGANLGSEDTSSPYTITWNSTMAANGAHVLTAVARDAAGNTTTASNVNVTVSNGGGGGSGNLALNKPVVASSTDGYAAANVVDGVGATRWASIMGVDPQWIYVDLGATYAINRVKLTWEAAYGKTYQIQVSNDAVTWTSIYSTTTGAGGVNDLTGLSGSGRYVRMYGTQRGTTYGYSLWELEVYGTGGDGGGGGGTSNLALNRAATASSVSGTYVPDNASDGSTGTRWSSNYSDNEWIYLDLGASYSINRIKLTWETAYGKSYKIQVSTNGTTWTDIYSTTTGAGGINDLTGLSGTGRYVRMIATLRGLPGYGYSLWEFEVYGN